VALPASVLDVPAAPTLLSASSSSGHTRTASGGVEQLQRRVSQLCLLVGCACCCATLTVLDTGDVAQWVITHPVYPA
jgi:hypothetical protein